MSYQRCASISLRQLQIFAAVGRERSFARAADALDLSQPAVSEQLKLLEHLLGVKLLLRSPGRKRVDLTEAGQILLSTCNTISEKLDRADRVLDALRGLDRGVVTFGAELCFGGYVLPRVHSDFRRRFSGVVVQPEVEHVYTLLQGVRQGTFDLVVAVGPIEDPGLVCEPLGGYDVLLIGPPGHRFARGEPVPFAALASDNLVLPKRPFILRSMIDDMAAQAGIELQVAMEVNHIEAKVQAVTDGIGIAPIGTYGAAAGLAASQLSVLRVEGFPVRMNWSIVSLKGELSPGAQAYKAHLLQYRSMLENNAFPSCFSEQAS